MPKSFLVQCAVLFGLLVVNTADISLAQSSVSSLPLSLEDIVKDSKSGIPEELIITKIKKNNRPFNLSGEEMKELTNSGISSTVIKYLLDPSQPYAPTPAPAGPTNQPARAPDRTKNYPPDAQASRVPLEPGLYRIVEGAPQKTEIRLLLGQNQGKVLIIKKGKAIGYLLGPTANTKISEPNPVFYLRLPEGKAIEEVVLLALNQTKDRREIEIGQTLEKQELKAESMRRFESTEVGLGLFKVTPSNLTKGEYIFLLLGSAEPPKGSYGKVYDFSIQGPPKK